MALKEQLLAKRALMCKYTAIIIFTLICSTAYSDKHGRRQPGRDNGKQGEVNDEY